MTVSQAVQEILVGNTALVAVVPHASIRVPGQWQNLARPYVIHQPVTIETIQTHQGLAGMITWPHYQVSVFASTYGEAEAVARLVISALKGVHMVGSPAQALVMFLDSGPFYVGRDDEFQVEHCVLNFRAVESFA